MTNPFPRLEAANYQSKKIALVSHGDYVHRFEARQTIFAGEVLFAEKAVLTSNQKSYAVALEDMEEQFAMVVKPIIRAREQAYGRRILNAKSVQTI